MSNYLIRTVYVAFSVIFLSLASNAQAATNLSVTPMGGGASLRMSRISSAGSVAEEVRIRVTSTDNQRYQVFQRFVNPLVNSKNQPLGRGAFVTNTVAGSNATVTLYAQTPDDLNFAEQLLYSSSSNGDSDSFTVSYNILKENIQQTGNFSGKILYTLRPLGGSTQQEIYLSVYLDADSDFEVEVESNSGGQAIEVTDEKDVFQNTAARISFKGNLGRDVKVYQELDIYPQSELMEDINEGYVQFMTSGSGDGSLAVTDSTDLNYRRTLLYSSQKDSDEFFVNYSVKPENEFVQNAGNFTGRVKYIIEVDGKEYEKFLNLNIVVKPVFEIKVQLPPNGMRFERVVPEDPPQVKEVLVTVTTNLGKPYTVVQNFTSPLSNEKGQEIDRKYFTIKGELLGDAQGQVSYNDFESLPQSWEDTVYVSDAKGSSAQFKMLYRLKPYAAVNPGSYTAAIVYTLGVI